MLFIHPINFEDQNNVGRNGACDGLQGAPNSVKEKDVETDHY